FLHAGTFAERTVVLESTIAKIPREAPLERACLAACAVATGVGASIEAANIKPGSVVAVFGMGGIGLNAVQGARFAGASRIV
ncbi:S-(hydroxymethyl)glutathione dehydrogenase, partial [Pseudomonas sp. SIMBA_077]